MKTLALDISRKTGFAIGGESGVERSGVAVLRGRSTEERIPSLATWLEATIARHRPDAIAMERPFSGGNRSSGDGWMFRSVVILAAYAHGLELSEIATSSLKLAATGNGKASKAEMIAAARDHFGFDPIDDNEADALHVLAWARGEIGEDKGARVEVDADARKRERGTK